MDPDETGQQGGMSHPLGVHWLVWLGIAAVGAYFLFFRNSSGGSTSGGGGTITTGNTTVDRGAVTIKVSQGQPQPPTTGKTTGLYFHSHPKGGKEPYFTKGGKPFNEKSGSVTIAGKKYYYHSKPAKGGEPYFTYRGKKVSPPSGVVS